MEKILYSKFDKKRISSLPRVVFPGRIIVVNNEQDAIQAVNYLLSRPLLGVDTETRPTFHKGEQHRVALLQVSDESICFLFRLNIIGMSESVLRLLTDRTVPKVGLSLHDDIMMLHRRSEFTPGYFIDLQDIVGSFGIKDLSLQKLYANIFGKRISKREQLSNWEARTLNDKQKLYAATDAWACVMLYNELKKLRLSGEYQLEVVPEPQLQVNE